MTEVVTAYAAATGLLHPNTGFIQMNSLRPVWFGRNTNRTSAADKPHLRPISLQVKLTFL